MQPTTGAQPQTCPTTIKPHPHPTKQLLETEESILKYLTRELELLNSGFSYLDVVKVYKTIQYIAEPQPISYDHTQTLQNAVPSSFIPAPIPFIPSTSQSHTRLLTFLRNEKNLLRAKKEEREKEAKEKKPRKRYTKREKEKIKKVEAPEDDESCTVDDNLLLAQMNEQKKEDEEKSEREKMELFDEKKEKNLEDKTENLSERISEKMDERPNESPKETTKHTRKRKLRSATERKPTLRLACLEKETKQKSTRQNSRETNSPQLIPSITQTGIVSQSISQIKPERSLYEDHLSIISKAGILDLNGQVDFSNIVLHTEKPKTAKVKEDKLKDLKKMKKEVSLDSSIISKITQFCTNDPPNQVKPTQVKKTGTSSENENEEKTEQIKTMPKLKESDNNKQISGPIPSIDLGSK